MWRKGKCLIFGCSCDLGGVGRDATLYTAVHDDTASTNASTRTRQATRFGLWSSRWHRDCSCSMDALNPEDAVPMSEALSAGSCSAEAFSARTVALWVSRAAAIIWAARSSLIALNVAGSNQCFRVLGVRPWQSSADIPLPRIIALSLS